MKITLLRVGVCYWVEHFLEWMKKPLTAQVKRYVDSEGKHVNDAVIAHKECFQILPDGAGLFLAGLLDLFVREAAVHGYEVVVRDVRDPNPMRFEASLDNIPCDFRYKQDTAIKAIAENDKGIILCTTGFGKSVIIKMLCLMYPTARIVVATAAKDVVMQLYKNISQTVGKDAVGGLWAGTPSTEEDKRVVITTCGSMMRAPLEKCDFFLFDEVHHVGDNKTFDQIKERCTNCRMFGFTASLSRSEGNGGIMLIKGLFGDVLATCTYQEAVAHELVTPIKAFMPSCPGSSPHKVGDNAVFNKKNFYWHNWARNNFIADIASHAPEDQQTMIYVETLEHAIYLKHCKGLEDWPIIFSGKANDTVESPRPYTPENVVDNLQVIHKATKQHDVLTVELGDALHPPCYKKQSGELLSFYNAYKDYTTEEGKVVGCILEKKRLILGEDPATYNMTKKQRDAVLSEFCSGKIKRAIITSIVKEGIDIHGLRILVRADGVSSDVVNTQLPGRLSRIMEGKSFALLFDPFDEFNEWVKIRSIQRQRFYRKQGWL